MARRGISLVDAFLAPKILSKPFQKAGSALKNKMVFAKDEINNFRKRQIENRQKQMSQREFEIKNNSRIEKEAREKEIKKIEELFATSLGINVNKIRTNPKLREMAQVIHSIFGTKISLKELKHINKILSIELSKNSPTVMKSPILKKVIDNISKGRASQKDRQILVQVAMDILAKDEISQQIMQSKGLM